MKVYRVVVHTTLMTDLEWPADDETQAVADARRFLEEHLRNLPKSVMVFPMQHYVTLVGELNDKSR